MDVVCRNCQNCNRTEIELDSDGDRYSECDLNYNGDGGWYIDLPLDCDYYVELVQDTWYYLLQCTNCGRRRIEPWKNVIDRDKDASIFDKLHLHPYRREYVSCSCGTKHTVFKIIQLRRGC